MANQIVVSAGAKVRNLDGVLTATSGVVSSLPIDGSLGIPQLDINGKILVSQLPNSVMEYKGTWNVSTNTPTLVNGTGNQGDVYLVEGAAVGGTAFNFGAGPITFFNGDQAIYSGSIWQRASGATGTVTSVAITESGDSLNITGSPITTSGTINIGFNGTNLQYVNGAGNLTTFPTLTGYVPYTGATANVDLGVYDLTADLITGAIGSFASNGGSDTFAINHSSGGGIALNITKGGAGEGLYINKTSGSGNAATIIGGVTLLDELHLNTDLADAYIASATNWNTAYSLRISSATLPLSITSNVISISQATTSTNGYLSSTDWNTFNGKESALTFSYPLSRVGNTISIPIATASTDGYLTDTDWFIFNSKQAALSGTGFVKISGTTISYDNSTYYLASNPSAFIALTALSAGVGISYNNTTGVITNSAPDQTVSLTAGAGISVSGTYPSFTIASTITQYTDALARAAISLTTTGTSGASTYNSTTGVFNIPNYTPDLSNYVDLTTNQTIGGTKTFSNATKNDGGIFLQNGSSNALAGYMNLGGLTNGLKFTSGGGISNTFTLPSATGYTFTFPLATGTIALTSDVPSLSGTAPISYSAGVISISQATTSTNGYLSSTDWNTFNLKQAQLNGTGFVKATGTTISYDNTNYLPLTGGTLTGPLSGTSGTFTQLGAGVTPINYFSVRTGTNNIFDIYDNGTGPAIQSVNDNVTAYRPLFFFATAFTFSNSVTATSFVKTSGTSSQFLKADGSVDSSTYALDSAVVHNTGNETVGGTKTFSDATKNNGGIFLQNASSNSLAGYMNIGGLTNGVKFTSGGGISNTFTLPSATGYTYTFPNATGTIALTSDIPSLTGYVNTSGTPTTNYLPKFTGTSTIGNSVIVDNGGNIGIGTASSAVELAVYSSSAARIQVQNSTTGVAFNDGFQFAISGSDGYVWNFENANIIFGTNNTAKMRLDASGNLGLGVTPSAWSGFTALQLGGNTYSAFASSNNYLIVSANTYYDGTGFKYITTGGASRYQQSGGGHEWHTAPSGTAGAAITFTQAMTLTASGNLGIGVSPDSRFHVGPSNGAQVRIDYVSSGDNYYDGVTHYFRNGNGAANIMTLLNNGNVLIGTNTDSGYKLDVNGTGRFTNTLQLDKAGGLAFRAYYGSGNNLPLDINLDASNGDASLTFNTTYNSGWKYFVSNFAARISNAGTLKFQVAPNGTAGNTITWVDALAFNNTTGAATFSSTVTAGGKITVNGGGLLLDLNGGSDTSSRVTGNRGNGDNLHIANIEFYNSFSTRLVGEMRGITGSGGTQSNSGQLEFYTNDNGTYAKRLTIASGGGATFTSSVTATSFFESSDSRLKTLIQDNYQTKGIASITPKLYTKNGKVELGYYAQDFVGVLDSAVVKGNDDMLSLSYREVHTAKIYALEQEIKELKAKLN